ncbi:hypothetical protein FHW02_004368 [Ochrobactrum sp. RH1CCR137]|uniref:hypothetical protein n=1 Tax=Brucella intermedia TaxID=94625 RepID=UPI000EFCC401|nr:MULTISPECIES: hypothetical protein [Brucella/Ochrobactrum group]MBA8846278.1 hypothetical protein [Ochrobactrum sp. RH1CCR137]MBA8858096.1 hypothetical protein [Ochrobactrum sp. RH1CCR134]MCB4919710.1 hypothetical protein [Brucella intermedia]
MAVLSDYTSGTITVTQNSVNFTGTNTLWRTAQFREGDTVQLKGYTAIIAAASASDPRIASNTAGTFTEPWPGPSGTFAYRMRFMPDGARVTAQTTTLIELLGNGVLSNIASVPVQEGKLLVGNAAGQYEPKDYIADPNGNLVKLAALTLAANKILNTNASGNLTQSDRVGTVSQSGGVPTGALIEKGGNANGYYTRWEDGTQIAWGRQNFNVSVPAGQSNAPVLTPPIAFATGNPARTLAVGCFYTGSSGAGTPLYTLQYGSNFNNSESVLGLQFLNCGVNPATAYPGFTIGSSAAGSLLVSFHTIGRWF